MNAEQYPHIDCILFCNFKFILKEILAWCIRSLIYTQYIKKRKMYIFCHNFYDFKENYFKFTEKKEGHVSYQQTEFHIFRTRKHYVFWRQSRVPINKKSQEFLVINTLFYHFKNLFCSLFLPKTIIHQFLIAFRKSKLSL